MSIFTRRLSDSRETLQRRNSDADGADSNGYKKDDDDDGSFWDFFDGDSDSDDGGSDGGDGGGD